MNNNSIIGYSKAFYAVATISVAGFIGGVYYLYSLFKGEPNLTIEQETLLEEIENKIDQSNGELSIDSAIQIMAMTNKIAENSLNNAKPDIDSRRRAALNNEIEYEKICHEYLSCKEDAYHSTSNTILSKFNILIEDLRKVLSKLSPYDLEKKLQENVLPVFEQAKPNPAITKDGFIFYGNKFIQEMEKFTTHMNTYKEEMDQDTLMFKLLQIKMRCDDELYIRYKINESNLRFLLFKYNLYEDKEIKILHDKITKFDNMLN